MKVQQKVRKNGEWDVHGPDEAAGAQLVLVFGSERSLREPATWSRLQAFYPYARIVGCSSAGEIAGVRVLDDSVTATAITFDNSHATIAGVQLTEAADGEALGSLLASRLPAQDLVHVLVLSEGLNVNGSALVCGLAAGLPAGVAITGGLAGDDVRFERTAVCIDGPATTAQIAAIGLYGPQLRIGHGSLGGWDSFGPERQITRARGNVLYELDGESALDLYKRYLGDDAAGLPAAGLNFPLAIRAANPDSTPVVRTILAVDEQARSMTFAGDVPTGWRARLMQATFERLLDGATGAARASRPHPDCDKTDLAILISCVGRKLVLKQRVEEEIEAVREVLGKNTALTGFYSYGEIAPLAPATRSELHNQTMTITTISEC